MSFSIDSAQYRKTLLDQAKTGGRDFFARYGLPLGCDDDSMIDEALEAVPRIWTQFRNNPRYQKIITLMMSQHGDVSKVLRDPTQRREHHTEIKSKVEEKFEQVRKEFAERVNFLKGQQVATIQQIAKLHGDFGGQIPKEQIDGAVASIPILADDEKPCLDRTEWNNIVGYQDMIGAKDLYDFLGLVTADRGNIARISAANREREAAAATAKVTPETEAVQKLCNYVVTCLLDRTKKERYDNTLARSAQNQFENEIKNAEQNGIIGQSAVILLLKKARGRGLSETDARTTIIKIAARYDWHVVFKSDGGPHCPRCNLAIEGDPARCPNCHSSLSVECPGCGGKCHTYDPSCRCGLDVVEFQRLNTIRDTWRAYFELGLYTDLKKDLADAVAVMGRSGWVAAAIAEVEATEGKLHGFEEEYRKFLREKKIFAARQALDDLRARSPEASVGGEPCRKLLEDLGRAINKVETRLAAGRKLQFGGRLDEAAVEFQEAIRLAADCEEAREGLQGCPPDAPGGPVTARQTSGAVVVSWQPSPSSGSIRYIILRKRGSASTAASDGEKLHETAGTTVEDKNFEVGRTYVYTVFANREGVVSRTGVASGSVLPTAEVDQLRIEAGDGLAQGSWRLPGPEVAEVAVVRRVDREPRNRRDGDEVRLSSQSGFVCKELTNGHRVFFRICCGYRGQDGQLVWTPGLAAHVTPAAPPPPVGGLATARRDEKLRFTWTAPARGEVHLLRCRRLLKQQRGTTHSRETLMRLGQPMRNLNARECEDREPPPGVCYYVALTVDGDMATVGDSLRVANLPEVTDLDARYLGRVVRCVWTWPQGCIHCAVSWRHDRMAASHDEPGTETRIVSVGGYNAKGCFELPVDDRRDHHICVFAAAMDQDGDIYSGASTPGARALIPIGQGGLISYTVTPIKNGRIFPKVTGYRVLVTADKPIAAPRMLLIKMKGKRSPTEPGEGEEILHISGRALGPSHPFETVLDAARLGQRPFVLKLFLAQESDYDRFQLMPPPPASLVYK